MFRSARRGSLSDVKARCLRLTTFNCKNIRTSDVLFEEFLKIEDMILIQEHWLFKCQTQLLDEINGHYNISGKAVDHYKPIP